MIGDKLRVEIVTTDEKLKAHRKHGRKGRIEVNAIETARKRGSSGQVLVHFELVGNKPRDWPSKMGFAPKSWVLRVEPISARERMALPRHRPRVIA